jgi:hypothetical protein
MNNSIQIRLNVTIQPVSRNRVYYVASMKGALTFRSADAKQDFGPGQWITEKDAQRLAELPEIYEITVTPALDNSSKQSYIDR